MTITEAAERLGIELEPRGHFNVALLIQQSPFDYMDDNPPPGEGRLARLQRWWRRRSRSAQTAPIGVCACPLAATSVDESQEEFLLWPDYSVMNGGTPASTCTVRQLHAVLAEHAPGRGHFLLDSAMYSRDPDPGRGTPGFRLDWGILGVAIDDEGGLFGFLAGPGWDPAP